MFAALFLSASGIAPAGAEEQGGMPEDMAQMMAKAKEAGTPGAGHEVLKSVEGEWNVASRHWMKPGDKPQESAGTSTITWILGGRYLKQEFKGEMMGRPYEGLGFVGYDNVRKEYASVWMDNMSTGLFRSTGQYDKGSKTIKDEGTFSCPVTGEKNMWFRSEWKIAGKSKHVFSMFMKGPDGNEFKSMELVYTRAK
jgi:hypothetical protein